VQVMRGRVTDPASAAAIRPQMPELQLSEDAREWMSVADIERTYCPEPASGKRRWIAPHREAGGACQGSEHVDDELTSAVHG